MKLKEIITPTVCLFIICSIITAVLAIVNLVTTDAIMAQEEKKQNDSCNIVLPSAKSFKERNVDNINFYAGFDDRGELIGYTFTTKAKGYGGDIKVMTGIDKDAEVCGVVILSQSETPGLGSNTTKDSFTDQYKQMSTASGFNVVRTAPSSGQIQAVTGATISSTAVTKAVNEAIEDFSKISKGGQ